MIVAFSGSRHLWNADNVELVNKLVEQFKLPVTKVICGHGQGFDQSVLIWAFQKNIPYKPFPADWKKDGKKAGPIRNKAMIKEAEALIAVPFAEGKGTRGTIKLAEEKGIPVFIHEVKRVRDGREV